MILSILVQASQNIGFSDHRVISGFIAALVALLLWWFKVTYKEYKLAETARADALKLIKTQVYKNKEDILESKINDQNTAKDYRRMQKSIDEMSGGIKELVKEIHELSNQIASIQLKKS